MAGAAVSPSAIITTGDADLGTAGASAAAVRPVKGAARVMVGARGIRVLWNAAAGAASASAMRTERSCMIVKQTSQVEIANVVSLEAPRKCVGRSYSSLESTKMGGPCMAPDSMYTGE